MGRKSANRLECATFHILTSYPGTPLFSQLEALGRILHRDWDLYKRSNRFWHVRIRHRLTAAMWRPLIEHSRRRYLRLRPRLEVLGAADAAAARASQ